MIPYSPSISHAADGLSTTNAIYKWLKGESLPTPDIELAYDEMVIQTTGYQNRKTGRHVTDAAIGFLKLLLIHGWKKK